MAKDFKQYNYDAVYSDEPFARAGCGPTSCADLIEVSPLETANWLTSHGYSTHGYGTAWEGISACLKAYGKGGAQLNYHNLINSPDSSVTDAWKNVIKAGFMGILLMGVGKSAYWTSGGHYIAIVSYSASEDKYLVYDPASTTRTGWHSWSDFEGDIKICYTSTIKWAKGTEFTIKFPTIQLGDRSSYVSILQCMLRSLGLYTTKYEIDGVAGNGTKAAIIAFQQSRKLTVDGYFGQQCWAAITGIAGETKTYNQVQFGDKNIYVYNVQMVLCGAGYYEGALDRSFGNGTKKAVELFQRDAGITVDGICGAQTYSKLFGI